MHRVAQELNDPVWDCTLIKLMKEHGSTVVNPIYEWSDNDVWDYIRSEQIKTNPLYQRGYSRVGCIGCPLASYKMRLKEFADYPTYKQMYINTFEKMVQKRKTKGKDDKDKQKGQIKWESGEDVFNWWLETYKREVKGQMNITDYLEAADETQ